MNPAAHILWFHCGRVTAAIVANSRREIPGDLERMGFEKGRDLSGGIMPYNPPSNTAIASVITDFSILENSFNSKSSFRTSEIGKVNFAWVPTSWGHLEIS